MNKLFVKNILSRAKQFNKEYKAKKIIRKKLNKILKIQIIQEVQEGKQNKINNELKKINFYKLANKNKITESELANVKKFNAYSLKTLQLIAKVRNINANLSKKDIIHSLIKSEPAINEERYISYLNKDTNIIHNEINKDTNIIHNEINKIRMQALEVSPYLNKKILYDIRKRLYDIEKKR